MAKECPPLAMHVAKQRAPRLLAYLPMPEKSERPVLLSCQRWPCCAPWSPRAGRSLPRRFPLPAPFWARLPVSRAQKKNPPCAASTEKKNLPVFRWCLDAVPVPVPACGLCMPQKNERPSGSPTYLCRKKTSAFGPLALSPEKKRKPGTSRQGGCHRDRALEVAYQLPAAQCGHN